MCGMKTTLSHFQMLHTMDTSERWRINQVLSINAAVRQLKKEENGLYNCICSILTDAHFVTEAGDTPPPSPPHPIDQPPPRGGPLLQPRGMVHNLDLHCAGVPDASVPPGVCQPALWALVCAESSADLLLQVDRRPHRQLELQPHTTEPARRAASRVSRRLLRGRRHTAREDIPCALSQTLAVAAGALTVKLSKLY